MVQDDQSPLRPSGTDYEGQAAPATKGDLLLVKQDVQYIMERIGDLEVKVEDWKDELKEHFDIVAENILHDFKGTFKDRTEDHERRIKRLERKTGITA
jgi:hypothetical protein